ncbi:helix-turn-helix domain-containing protein, partial [Anaeroarcus burkinensis]
MAKYSFEFKLKVVQEYLNGKGGYVFLSKKYNIPAIKDIQKWVAIYNRLGEDGLLRSRKNQTYSLDFKLHVVELYLTTEVSYQELALQLGMNTPSLIA